MIIRISAPDGILHFHISEIRKILEGKDGSGTLFLRDSTKHQVKKITPIIDAYKRFHDIGPGVEVPLFDRIFGKLL